MKKVNVLVVVAMCAIVSLGYEVKVGTVVCNPGKTVCVPVSLDDARGASFTAVRVAYDPQVLVVMKVEEGSLCKTLSDDFIVTADESAGIVSFALFGTNTVSQSVSGTLARLHFAVRDGTAGLYSDLAVAGVQFGDVSSVRDITVSSAVTTVNGMVRVMRETAEVARLENAEVIVADTALGALALSAGDAIQASDAQTAITVSGAVTAVGAIAVKEPANGWASGRYALLSTTTPGLTFSLEGVDGATFSAETVNGVTTYYANISVAGEIAVTSATELSAGTKNQIRSMLSGQLDGVTEIVVTGPEGNVDVIADMGIAPSCTRDGTRLLATYAMPELRITQFDPQTGVVRFKVTPGTGNQIVSEIATGYIHVFGTDNLGEKMKYISKVGFDLTPYLKAETKGEGTIFVTLGTHTFLKIKVEALSRVEGQVE